MNLKAKLGGPLGSFKSTNLMFMCAMCIYDQCNYIYFLLINHPPPFLKKKGKTLAHASINAHDHSYCDVFLKCFKL